MNLALIGKKSVQIADLVEKNLDDVTVMRYDTIAQFVQDTQSRGYIIDRIILMQDAYIDLEDLDFTLSSFNEYLQTNFEQTRFITLSNNAHNVSILAGHFWSQLYAHIYFSKVKPSVLLSIVTDPIDVVKKKYEKIDNAQGIEAVVEVIEEHVEEKQEDEDIKGKKKGLFGGLFGKKNKKNKKKEFDRRDIGHTPIGQGQGVEEFTDYGEGEGDEAIGVTHQYSDDDYSAEMIDDITNQYAQEDESEEYYDDNEYYDDSWGDEEDEEDSNSNTNSDDDDLQFTMESTVIGEDGVSLSDSGFGDFNDEVDDWGSDDSEFDSVEFNEDEDEPEYETELDKELEGANEAFEEDDNSLEEDNDSNWYMPDDEDYTSNNDSEEPMVNVDDSYNEKIKELGKQHTEAGENIVIPKVNIPNKTVNPDDSIITEEVESDMDVFGDISSMEQEYEEANTKTVVKEKVVEKIIEVNKGGNSRNYKNGVRLVVVTGDRKTGVTRTALNLANMYAKNEPTLFVDLDVDRHGSLSYIGLEDIVEAPEHVQNGLGHLKHERMLKNLVMYIPSLSMDCIFSSYDSDISDEQFKEVQSIIAHQKEYKNVIVDCPIEKLFMLEDILVYSEVLICVEPYMNCVINTVDVLESIDDKKLSALMSRHCGFILTKGKTDALKSVLKHTSDVFDLDSRPVNWARVPLAGTIKDLKSVAERL